MAHQKKKEGFRLHKRNKNRDRYDLSTLIKAVPELTGYLTPNKKGENSIDFSNPKAVKLLNKALLHYYYGITFWDFPDKNLCPPIPGRADYIHHMADLLVESNFGRMPEGEKITCLDIGIGASCIYPIIGVTEYNWTFIGADIDSKSIEASKEIINANPQLKNKVTCRLQKNKKDIFFGIINKEDKIDLSICNPPFHASAQEAEEMALKKVQNLTGRKMKTAKLNFAGISNELICDGGEYKFISEMVRQSEKFSKNCFWFSTLVSKKSNVNGILKSLDKANAVEIKTIPMGTGNKSSRVIAWTFLSHEEQKHWREKRWSNKKSV